MTVTLLIGGARSGKSSLAVARALEWQRAEAVAAFPIDVGCQVTADDTKHRAVVFVATGSAGDEEMAHRIQRHQGERPSSWATVEAPIDLAAGLRSACEGHDGALGPALIVDCVSMWVANHLMGPIATFSQDDLSDPVSANSGSERAFPAVDWDLAEQELLRQVDECFSFLTNRSAPTWFVTNEVGLSLVPMSAMGRRYRDVLGRVNARVSLLADEAFLTVAGRVVRLERP
jgi:adenosylcobinamide kinase / adenosylcobinamide-phosphate guanylyltransferase